MNILSLVSFLSHLSSVLSSSILSSFHESSIPIGANHSSIESSLVDALQGNLGLTA